MGCLLKKLLKNIFNPLGCLIMNDDIRETVGTIKTHPIQLNNILLTSWNK